MGRGGVLGGPRKSRNNGIVTWRELVLQVCGATGGGNR